MQMSAIYPNLACEPVGHIVGHISPQRRKDLVPFDSKSLIHMVRLAGIEPTTPWFVVNTNFVSKDFTKFKKLNLIITNQHLATF
jgi:hypothetical protein